MPPGLAHVTVDLVKRVTIRNHLSLLGLSPPSGVTLSPTGGVQGWFMNLLAGREISG